MCLILRYVTPAIARATLKKLRNNPTLYCLNNKVFE